MRLLAIDPSLRNTGVAIGTYLFDKSTAQVDDLALLKTEADKSKQVRKNSDDLRCALQIHEELHELIDAYRPKIIFVEVPSGTQSARASWTLGITVGILASVMARPIQLVQVAPQPVKLHFAGSKTASKQQMIDTAMERHPHLPWRLHRGNPTNDNEHLADAVAILEYGLSLPETKGFLELARLMRAEAA